MIRSIVLTVFFCALFACSGPKSAYFLDTADWQDIFSEFFPEATICEYAMQIQYTRTPSSPNLPPPPQAHLIYVPESLILELAELEIWQESADYLIEQLRTPLIKGRYHQAPFSILNDCDYGPVPIEGDEEPVLHFSKPYFSSNGEQLMLFVEETYLSRGIQKYYLFNQSTEGWTLRKKQKFNEWIQ